MLRGKCGKLPARVNPLTPKLVTHLTAPLAYPDKVEWDSSVKPLTMLGNDQVGDCTAAGVYHLLQVWAANTGFPTYVPQTADALMLYGITGGYPQRDDGAVELDVLEYWRTTGIDTGVSLDKPAYCTLHPQDMDELRYATAVFGGVYLGMALPLTVQAQIDRGAVWDVATSSRAGAADPGSYGGHCVTVTGYEKGLFRIYTWGEIAYVTDAFMAKYCDEAYAVISESWLADSGLTPQGLNLAALQDAMKALG